MEVEFYVWPPEHFFLFQIGSACIVNKEKKRLCSKEEKQTILFRQKETVIGKGERRK